MFFKHWLLIVGIVAASPAAAQTAWQNGQFINGQPLHAYDLNANNAYVLGKISQAGVTLFNTRSGSVTLLSADITAALGYTPYSTANSSGYQTAANVAATLAASSITIGGQAVALGTATNNQGNGPLIQLSTGTAKTNGHCVQFDANGNTADAGAACGGGGGGSGTVTSSAANSIAYYSSTGTAVTGLAPVANSVLVTNGSGTPSESQTLPSGLVIPSPSISSPTVTGTASVGVVNASGKITVPASSVSGTGLNIGVGSGLPSSPVSGDVGISSTVGGLFYRNGSTTVVPPSAVNGTGPITTSQTGSVVTAACATCLTSSSGGALAVSGAPLLLSGSTLSLTNTFVHTAVVNFDSLTTVHNDTYYLLQNVPYAAGLTITSVRYFTGGTGTPTFTASLKINGTNVTGCNNLTVTASNTAPGTLATCTGTNAATSGQAVTLVISGTSGTPVSAGIQVNYTSGAL